MKILTISDGNGVDVKNCPKWPTILNHLTNCKIKNRSIVGASNETMFNILRDEDLRDIDHVIIQWSSPNRFDTIIDNFWAKEAENDPTYYFNIHDLLDSTWWISSGSKNSFVREYHTKYVKEKQAKHRTISNMWAAVGFLGYLNISYTFSLCYDLDLNDEVSHFKWAWHKNNGGIRSFSETSQYKDLDDPKLPRPHPLVQLEWIKEVLAPAANIEINDKRYHQISELFKQRAKDNLLLQL